ncbi:MAG: histidinol-phosphatase HisJ family protein [Planctomycetes bacterium]|nr:histidinol-phosphatase HisJ family protein [Planctomycetota bacterium]
MPRLLYEQHCHTPLCRHAAGEPEEYAMFAYKRGLAGIVFTCHNPMPDSYGHAGRMRADEVDEYVRIVKRATDAFAGKLDVRLGMECDYFPGYLEYVRHTLAPLNLNHVLGSVHPFLHVWVHRFGMGTPMQTQINYFDQIAEAAETELFDTIAHPDLVKNMTASDWDFHLIQPHIERALDRIASTGCAMELNTSGLNKTIPEMNPSVAMLKLMRARKIPVVIGADAHVPERVAANFVDACDRLTEAGYTHINHFIDRKRHELPIDAVRASLTPAQRVDA